MRAIGSTFSSLVIHPPTMLFNTLLVLSALSFAAAVPQEKAKVFTVTRVVHSLTDVAPFIVDATTTLTFTPSPSTSIAFPTGTGI
ncbi:hypothetical protein C8R43DRAFT_975853 [Mycena crocata]|nr:hypothetical protein C8R43DRAFT_975853 [Mycena crocata]